MNDIIAIKITSLQRCVARARSIWQKKSVAAFRSDYDLQDAAIMNILRACELAIDLANMVIRKQQLGIPADSRESFSILQREGLLPEQSTASLRAMVGFRNLAVHQYREIDLDIVLHILEHELDDLLDFARRIQTILAGSSDS